MRKKKIFVTDLFLIVVFVSIAIVTWWATKSWAITERLALVSIIIILELVVIPVINSLFSEIPKFEVLNPRVEIERVVDRVSRVSIAKTETHEVETKAVYIDVKNKNPDADLTDCKMGIETEIGDWDTLNLKNLTPDLPQKIRLFRIFPNSSIISLFEPFESKNGIKLDIGKVHELKIRFFGEKFVNKKKWHMELTLTSWDSHNLRFKIHREMLKKKLGKRR